MIKALQKKLSLLKDRCPAIIFHSGIIFVFSQLGAVINFITNLLIVPQYLDANDLGLIAPVTQFVALGAIPLSVVTNLVIKYITKYEANEQWGKLKRIIRDLIIFGLASTFVISVFFLVIFKNFAIRAKIDSRSILLLMLIYLCVSSWTPLVGILIRATQRFFIMGIMGFISPLVLMLCSLTLLPKHGFNGYMIALIISIAINVLISFFSIYKYLKPHKEHYQRYFQDVKPLLKKYAIVLVFGGVIGWLWLFVPPFAVRNFLSRADSAGFFFVQRLSMLPFYAFSSVMLILMPILSMKHEKRESTTKTVKGTILYTLFSGIIVTGTLYLFSPLMFKYVPQWREYSDYSKYIWLMSISVTLATINSILLTNFFAKWVFKPYKYTLPLSLFFVLLIYLLFGWGIMEPYLPTSIWQYIDNIPKGITLIIVLMVINNVVNIIINMIWLNIIAKNKKKYMNLDFI